MIELKKTHSSSIFLCVGTSSSVQKLCALMVEQLTVSAGKKPFHSRSKPKTRHFTNRNSVFRNPTQFRTPSKLRSHSLFRIPVQEPKQNECSSVCLCARVKGAAYVDIFHSFTHDICVHIKQFQNNLYYFL